MIRAYDIEPGDEIRIAGRWREVTDVARGAGHIAVRTKVAAQTITLRRERKVKIR